jgi:predicted O-methyltransferase YrrM
MANIIFISFTTIIFLPIFAIKKQALIYHFKSYIKFLKKSTNKHGVHSPFVYDFITKCLHKKHKDKIKKLNSNRKNLYHNRKVIQVMDFGAGSRVFKSKSRVISAIAKKAGISKKRGELLFNITNYLKAQQILEIGTSVGIATTSLSLGNPNAKIITLEGCPETAKIAQDQFKKFELNNIEIKIGDFKNTLKKVVQSNKFNLIFFDGNHQKEATIKYFDQCLLTAHNDTIFIFDDIHWSKGMDQAWEYIHNHEKVKVSIDTFQWGIVFFRKEQLKEHFIIRV